MIRLLVLFLLLTSCGPRPGADAGPDTPAVDVPVGDVPLADATPGAPPVITMVAWRTDPACRAMVPTDYVVETTVTDADTPAAMLTFTGMVEACPPALSGASSTIRCPNVAPYAGVVNVRDPEGHTASLDFVIAPCTDGSAEP